MKHAPRAALAAFAAVLVGGACTSQPSARAVATDIVESLPDLTESQRQCMLTKLEGYSQDDLEQIGEANQDVDVSQEGAGTAEMQAFIADLEACIDDG